MLSRCFSLEEADLVSGGVDDSLWSISWVPLKGMTRHTDLINPQTCTCDRFVTRAVLGGSTERGSTATGSGFSSFPLITGADSVTSRKFFSESFSAGVEME